MRSGSNKTGKSASNDNTAKSRVAASSCCSAPSRHTPLQPVEEMGPRRVGTPRSVWLRCNKLREGQAGDLDMLGPRGPRTLCGHLSSPDASEMKLGLRKIDTDTPPRLARPVQRAAVAIKLHAKGLRPQQHIIARAHGTGNSVRRGAPSTTVASPKAHTSPLTAS